MAQLAALGMIECRSMARGAVITDALLKTSAVELLFAQPVPPGKLLIAIHGGVADVESAVAVGLDRAGDHLEDALFIPRIHPGVAEAMVRRVEGKPVEALGIIETKTVAAAIRAADQALKSAAVELLSLRMGLGIGGKALFFLAGPVADVQAAVDAGRAAVRIDALFLHAEVIAQPHPDYAHYVSSGPGTVPPLPGVVAPADD